MRCGTRSTSTWMVAGATGELSWEWEGRARVCCRSFFASLQLAVGARVRSSRTPAGLTAEALGAAGPPITGLSLQVAILQLLQAGDVVLTSSALPYNWGLIGKPSTAIGALKVCNVPLPTVQGSVANTRHPRESSTVQYSDVSHSMRVETACVCIPPPQSYCVLHLALRLQL